jgi:hypothetical protein
MSKFAKVLKIVGVVVAVIGIGVLLGWLGGRGKPSANPQPLSSSPTADTAAASKAPSSLIAQASKYHPRASAGPNQAPVPAPLQPANLITNWDDKLNDILGTEGNDADKAKQMLEMFPRLPEEGQEEVAQHLSNLTPDENYSGLGQYLTNGTLSEAVLDVVMADLLNRPNSVKLPMLYEMARQGDQNPKAGDAKDILQLYLDDDYGDDWGQWNSKMTQWLKDNPD